MHEFICKKGLISQGDSQISGSLIVINNLSASAISSSYITAGTLTVPQVLGTASYANFSATSSLASQSYTAVTAGSSSYSITSSFLNPGATLYVVSGSNGVPPSFIDIYDTPVIPYNPPYKLGRMFFDSDYNNWVYYPDQNFKLHVGKEVIWRVANPYPYTLPQLSVVYLSGSTGNNSNAYLAIANNSGQSNAVGVIRYDIPSGSTGYVLQVGVMHNVDMTGFETGDSLWLSPSDLGKFMNTEPGQPYETVKVGYCQIGGSNGSIIIDVNVQPIPASAYAGVTSNISIQNNNDGTITVSTGSANLYNDSTGFGAVIGYPLESKTFSLVTGSTNYIVVEHSASLASYNLTTDPSYSNGLSVVRVSTLDIYTGTPTGSEWDVHVFDVGIVGLALANRSNNKDILLYGYQRQDGLTIYTGESSGSFGVTAGTIWYGPNSHAISDFNSTASGVDVYHFVSSGSGLGQVWTRHTQSVYDNAHYNDVGGIVPLTQNSWSVNFIYRLVGASEDGGYDDAALVLSTQQFATELEASNNANPPTNLPETIRDASILIGRIIIQSGSFTPTVDSAFSNIFVPAVVTQHNSLLGLQGGQGGEYYHMTAADYTGTGTGVMVRQNGAVLTNASISGSLFGTTTSASYVAVAQTASFVGLAQTASFVILAQSASYVATASYVDAATFITTAQTASYVSASNVIGKVSSALNADTASLATSISFAPIAATSASWVSASAHIINSDTASYVLNSVSASYVPNLYPQQFLPSASWASASLSASYAVSASNAISTSYVPNLYPQVQQVTVPSASWVSASVHITNADTASYFITSSVTSASFATAAGTASSISFVPNSATTSTQSLYATQSTYATQSAFATQSVNAYSASWVSASVVITTAATASYITASNVVGAVTTAVTAYSANAINFVPIAANSASWVSASAFITTAQTASFVTASNVIGIVSSASYALSSSNAVSASFASSASYALSASNAVSASYALSASNAVSASYTHSGSNAVTASYAISASNAVTASYALSASNAVTASYAISASNAISASYALSSSNAISASYASTASYIVDCVTNVLSGSNATHTGDLLAASTPLSFSMNAGETWVCEAFLSAQSSNNRGMRYAISSSAALGKGAIEGEILGNTNAVTALTWARITAVNSIVATTLHTQANTVGGDRIHFSVINPDSSTTISIALAVLNTGDTATAFAGSYLKAERVR